MHKRKGRDGRVARQERAAQRKATYETLTDEEKVLRLFNREKVGLNCERERAKFVRRGLLEAPVE